MRRRPAVLALVVWVLAATAQATPASADGHNTLVPEVCDDVGAPNEACLPVRIANAILVPIEPDKPIEQFFSDPGPWTVLHEANFACCDSAGNAYDVFRPRHLDFTPPLPIVTWGNGSGGSPDGTDHFLRHLASWGFVVVATREDNTGSGQEILEAAELMVQLNQDASPTNEFFGELDTEHVGAIGHSQGAAGVVAAMNLSGGLIDTAVALHMPNPYGCGSPPGAAAEECRDLFRDAAGPVFLVSGTFDFPISTAEGNQEYYGYVEQEKAMGLLKGTSHNDIAGEPACPMDPPTIGCFNGAYGYLGYPVAWMMDRLKGDMYARAAFTSGGAGELFSNRNWANQASDGIEAPSG